jgi:hypothetical protein
MTFNCGSTSLFALALLPIAINEIGWSNLECHFPKNEMSYG